MSRQYKTKSPLGDFLISNVQTLKNIYLQFSALFPWMLYLFKKHFNILNFVEAVVVYRIAIGDEFAGMIPVANRQGGYSKQSGNIIYG